MSPRIVHLFPRSPFLSFTAGVFAEAAPDASTFIVLGAPVEQATYAVPDGVRREWVVPEPEAAAGIIATASEADIVIAHSVGLYAARILSALPSSVLRVWSGWGGDYYGNRLSPRAGLLGPRTARLQRGRMRLRTRAIRSYRTWRAEPELAAAARVVDVFSAPIPDDLAVFRRRFRGFRGRYAQLNYATVEDTFEVGAGDVSGSGILLDNPADPTGNHLDVMAALQTRHEPGRRIVVPLAYGDPGYADLVEREGRRTFGDDFLAVRDFMPLAEFQSLLGSCSTMIMGHRRQQAIGNVATGLWTGASVVLDGRSPLHRFLAARGATVTTLQELGGARLPHDAVPPEARERNRAILREFWGRERVVANARALIDSV